MTEIKDLKDVVSIKEIKDITHFGEKKIYSLLHRQIIKNQRVDKTFLITKKDFLDFFYGKNYKEYGIINFNEL